MNITIDGKFLPAQEGETILEVATRSWIYIPSLCYREWAEPYGGCRLCSVEITKKSWDGWTKVVTACNYPVEDGLIVHTHTEKIIGIRKTLVDLLLARCPNTPRIQKLAAEYGIEETSFVPRIQPDDCILCGLCVRVCEVIGANAISTIQRGIQKEINTPFREANQNCIGCACCAEVCPTGHIHYEEKDGIRRIWHRDFKMIRCSQCGRAHITEEQMEHFLKKCNLPRSYFEKCEMCHKKETASIFYSLRTV